MIPKIRSKVESLEFTEGKDWELGIHLDVSTWMEHTFAVIASIPKWGSTPGGLAWATCQRWIKWSYYLTIELQWWRTTMSNRATKGESSRRPSRDSSHRAFIGAVDLPRVGESVCSIFWRDHMMGALLLSSRQWRTASRQRNLSRVGSKVRIGRTIATVETRRHSDERSQLLNGEKAGWNV